MAEVERSWDDEVDNVKIGFTLAWQNKFKDAEVFPFEKFPGLDAWCREEHFRNGYEREDGTYLEPAQTRRDLRFAYAIGHAMIRTLRAVAVFQKDQIGDNLLGSWTKFLQ